MAIKVLEVAITPNPNARKFVLSEAVTEGPVSFFDAPAAQGHELGRRLFEVPGVTSVLLLGDFITVNKHADAAWPEVVAGVKKVIQSRQLEK
jgi:hypothetical protein